MAQAVGQLYIGERTATMEGTRPYKHHTIRNIDSTQTLAILKTIIAYSL